MIGNKVEINIAAAKRKISRRHYSKIQSYKKKTCLLTGVLFACQHLLKIISLFIYLISSLCRIMFSFSFLPLARVFQCLFTLVLVSASSWSAEIWQLSRRWATGELDGVNSHSRDIVASSTSCTLPAARAPRRACSQANDFALCKACKVIRNLESWSLESKFHWQGV